MAFSLLLLMVCDFMRLWLFHARSWQTRFTHDLPEPKDGVAHTQAERAVVASDRADQ